MSGSSSWVRQRTRGGRVTIGLITSPGLDKILPGGSVTASEAWGLFMSEMG